MHLNRCHRPASGTGQNHIFQTRIVCKNLDGTLSVSCRQDGPVFAGDAPYGQALGDDDALIVGAWQYLNYVSRRCAINSLLYALSRPQGDYRCLGERGQHKCCQTAEYAN
jgi:hypothetical protein